MKIGVIGLQGAIKEHQKITKLAMDELGNEGDAVWLRKMDELDKIDGIIIPGGESTTIGKLMKNSKIFDKVREMGQEGTPILGTCAGLIVMAKEGGKEVEKADQPLLKLMDMKVQRNAFGRQRESFETNLNISILEGEPFRAVFIRSPAIQEVGEGVEILAKYQGKIVAAEQGDLLAMAFHPELTNDTRIHEYFLKKVEKNLS